MHLLFGCINLLLNSSIVFWCQHIFHFQKFCFMLFSNFLFISCYILHYNCALYAFIGVTVTTLPSEPDLPSVRRVGGPKQAVCWFWNPHRLSSHVRVNYYVQDLPWFRSSGPKRYQAHTEDCFFPWSWFPVLWLPAVPMPLLREDTGILFLGDLLIFG